MATLEHARGVFSTSHGACAVVPFEGHGALGSEGVPWGTETMPGAGLVCYDPWRV